MHFPKYILIALVLVISACQPQEKTEDLAEFFSAIPSLLDRPSDLRYEKEWEQVQSNYVRYRNELVEHAEKVKPRLKLAEIYTHEARVTGEHGHYYPAALKVLDEALTRSQQNPDEQFQALAMKAGVLLSLHQFAEALAAGQEAVAMNPYNAQIYGVLVDAYVELGQYDQAVAMADKMISIRPDLRSYARISYLRELHGDVEGAIEAMQLAVDAGYPGYEQTAWARLTLGDLYAQYGELEKAEVAYERILVDRPDYPFAIAALGEIAEQKGDLASAEEKYLQAAKIIPEFSFYEKLAALYQKQNRQTEFDQTIAELKVMLAEDQEAGHVMDLELSHLHAELLGDYETALEYAQKVYERRPDNIDINQTLAYIYHKQNRPALAAPHLQRAARTNSQHPELLALQQSLASL
ncbi:MAG: tetratricopeptide repeat protein [Saprospiraceae bacterium]|nr:tetratricopeptide repeat protein [Saprospiraceae bacterium]